VLGLLIVGAAVATALLVAAAARLPSLVSTVLAGYLVLAANVALTTLALSPFREVTTRGLTAAELVLLAGAFALWWFRGRPGLPLAGARTTVREALSDPATALFLVVVGVVLAYELVLGLTVPSNDGDSLSYHLAKAAAWAQHGGVYWIQNAPSVRMNAFQPLAEQENLFLFVATGSSMLIALPQYLAELAIIVAVYGASRRLGFEVRAATCGALLFATFSLVALEATTAQNDLVAASFPAVAACLLLGGGRLEPLLAGTAAGFGLGVKLTTGLVLPVLVWLAFVRGRRNLGWAMAGGVLGFAAFGMWGYVLNIVNTGHLLGSGTGSVENRASPSYPGSVANAFYLMYGTMDVSVLSNGLIDALALAGLVIAAGAAAWGFRRVGLRRALRNAAALTTPFLAPLLVLGASGTLAFVARRWGFPIRGPGGVVEPINASLNKQYTHIANPYFSAFGPVGIVALLAATALTIWAYAVRRVDRRHLVLAAALPCFLVLVSLQTTWNPYLTRFFLVPAVLAAPLLALLLRGRATRVAYLVVAALTVGLTITQDLTKPLDNPYGFGRPWNLTQAQALKTNSRSDYADALIAFDKLVPAEACVGAVLGGQEPAYLLYGPSRRHRVEYLSVDDALIPALRAGIFYVVISTGPNRWVANTFEAAGWQIRPLGGYWLLASHPHAGSGVCAA
jgi:hypothetical protein